MDLIQKRNSFVERKCAEKMCYFFDYPSKHAWNENAKNSLIYEISQCKKKHQVSQCCHLVCHDQREKAWGYELSQATK